MSPRVSLALPVYNGENFIAEAIHSILVQDFEDFELLITDNASTDRTEAICRAFTARDRRLRYIRNERNLGAAANFNLGFTITFGMYFKWCAHDDQLSSNFLRECVYALDGDMAAIAAYGTLAGIDPQGKLTGYIETAPTAMDDQASSRRFLTLVALQGLDAAMFGLYRREALAATSLHRTYYGSDCALLAEVAMLGRFVRVPGAILYSRDHPNRSVNMQSTARQIWQTPDAAGRNAFEFSQRMAHLVEIACRHRRAAPLIVTLPRLALWFVHPLRAGRCILEFIGAVSPLLRRNIRGWVVQGSNFFTRHFNEGSS
jgi:glycosyltransferase involved in cell wall biosynthesis